MRALTTFLAPAAAAALLLTAGTASAGTLPDGGVTANEVAAALKAKGYEAEITKDSGGDPMIRSKVQNATFTILFYGCKNGPRCASIQFTAGWDLKDGQTLAKINEWNFNKRFGRASLDDEKDPFVRVDVDMEHGATSESIENWIDTWEVVMVAFDGFIKEK